MPFTIDSAHNTFSSNTLTADVVRALTARFNQLSAEVVPIPEGYKLSANANAVLVTLQGLDSGQQITVFLNTLVDM